MGVRKDQSGLRLQQRLKAGGRLRQPFGGAVPGSPQAQRIMISRQSDLAGKKDLAKDIVGIEK